jgi:uncharacterized iron-regulated membrane protein
MKRLMFWVHRWGGIALALFMLLWFSSGLLIVFAEPPAPERAQLLAHAEALRPEAGWLSAGEAWDASAAQRSAFGAQRTPATGPGPGAGFVGARLLRLGGQPTWVLEDARGQRVAVSALDGSLQTLTAERALEVARSWAASSGGPAVTYLETLERPALLRNQELLRPFHRFALADGAGGELLVSAVTGEVVSASSRLQRGLFYAGNWVHLFRPLELLGATNDTRNEVVKWVALAALIAALTGLVVGWWRWRPGWFGSARYSSGRIHPYRERWLRWHFWAGLLGGVLSVFWALSGFVSTNPGHLFSPATPGRDELLRYQGQEVATLARTWRPAPLPASEGEVVELSWQRLGGAEALLESRRDGSRRALEVAGASAGFDAQALSAAAARLAPGARARAVATVADYDGSYYLRHHRDVADRPLPVARVELGDASGTRLYLDPLDGRLLLRTDRSREVYRWLYSALHHWDFGWLYRRPLWDGWMVLWVGLGWVLSVSAVVLGWRRLRQTLRRPEPRSTAEPALEPAGDTQLEG